MIKPDEFEKVFMEWVDSMRSGALDHRRLHYEPQVQSRLYERKTKTA